MPKYKFLEDIAIADIAYEAYGKNLNVLFENAALAILEMSADIKTIESKQKIEFNLENKKLDNLLYDFLSEILFLKDSKYMIFKEARVEIKEGKINKLNAVLGGETINPKKHRLDNDIKAITMHLFRLEKTNNGYSARIVVDI